MFKFSLRRIGRKEQENVSVCRRVLTSCDSNTQYGTKLEQTSCVWKHMIESDPTDAVPYNNYGNVLNRAGEYQDAVSHYRTALSLNQEYTEAWFNMANATLSDVILRKLFTYNELKKLFNEAHSVSTGTGGQGEDFKIGASEAVDMMVRGLRGSSISDQLFQSRWFV